MSYSLFKVATFSGFLFCDSSIYSSVNCGQTGVYLPTNVQTFQCLAPAVVTTNSDLWIPKTDYCGLPCDTFHSTNISLISSLRSVELFIHVLLFLLLHLASKTLVAPDFKFLRGSAAVNIMLCLSSILVPFFDNSFWCDQKTQLIIVQMAPKWTATFAFATLISCSQYVLLMLHLFWLLLRLKYFPMSKCVAFGDKEYQSLLKPGKRKTMNFLTISFLGIVVFLLLTTGVIHPDVISKLPVIEMENELLIHFKFSVETILALLLVATLVSDSLQHKSFKRKYALICLVVVISSFARFYIHKMFRESMSYSRNFFFEKMWKCNLIGSDECPDTLPSVPSFWPSASVILLNICDYIVILCIVFLMVPSLKNAMDLQSRMTSSFVKLKQLPSRLFSGDNTKVTILISNQSCDGKIETFYSPSPSMNNIKDIQIVRSDKQCDEVFRKEKIIFGETKPTFDTLVRAEIPDVTSHSLKKDHKPGENNGDHQLANCPECAKSIRVATWVNYLPQPVPKRKSFLPLDFSGSVKPRNYTCSCSPSSSNTMNPIFQTPYSMAIRNSIDQQQYSRHNSSATPYDGQPRSVPASPKLSARSHSVGSASQNHNASKDPYITFTANQAPLLESHRRILSQYNASPVTQRRKPLSPLVTGNRTEVGFPTGTQSNPTTLRVPKNHEENRTPSAEFEATIGGTSRLSCSTTSNEPTDSDSFDSEEETRTEIGLCTSIL